MREPERLLNVMNRPFHKRYGFWNVQKLTLFRRNDVNFPSCLRAFLLRQCLFVVEGMLPLACGAADPLVVIGLSHNWLDDEGASTRHAAGASRAATAVLDAVPGFTGPANGPSCCRGV